MRKLGSVAVLVAFGALLAGACSKDDESDSVATGAAGSGGVGGSGGTATGGAANGGGGTGGQAIGGAGNGGASNGGLPGTGAVSPGGAASGGAAGSIGVVFPPGCGLYGDPCVGAGDCCSNVCEDNACSSTVIECGAVGAACGTSTDCCNLNCVGSVCAAGACTPDGEVCAGDTECCGGTCTDGLCTPLNNSCSTAGNPCTGPGDCCSGLCGDDGICSRAASFCVQNGDVCRADAECCSAACTLGANGLGTCAPIEIGSANCDGLEGMLCSDCNQCCSRVCAPYRDTGVQVCQPARGCRVMGDLCRSDNDCCGSAGTGLPGSGNVFCLKNDDADPVGICRSPLGCSPQGNVCHFQDYVCSNSSSRNNCCGATGESGQCEPNASGDLVCGGTGFLCQPGAVQGDPCEPCLLDPFGVPRCNALGQCRDSGETCATSADCCAGMPCVPDDTGVLRCGETTCIPAGGSCTVDADCCAGLPCDRPIGSTSGTCGSTTPPPTGGAGGGGGSSSGGSAGSPSTGGTSTGGTPGCSLYGQQCSVDGDCCNSVPCTNGACLFPIG